VAEVAWGCKSGVFEKAMWLGEYIIDVGGDVCCWVGGDGTKLGGTPSMCWDPTGLMAPEAGIFEARSKKVPNLPRMPCHSFHFSFEVKRLYRMLLRNSTSMMCTSCTEMPETSAHVLFVYVLSSRNLLPSMRATVRRRYSLPGLPLTVGLVCFSLYMNSNAKRMTFWATCVVVKMVATHFRNPVVGCASGTRGCMGWRGDEVSTTCWSVEALSNQKRHVTYQVSTGAVGRGRKTCSPTSAAS